jgi:hypothetical protein
VQLFFDEMVVKALFLGRWDSTHVAIPDAVK